MYKQMWYNNFPILVKNYTVFFYILFAVVVLFTCKLGQPLATAFKPEFPEPLPDMSSSVRF